MMKNKPLIVEQVYSAPIAKVWKAITDRDQMKQWYFEDIESFKAEVGFETQVDVANGDKIYRHVWKITEVEPEKKLTYSWRYRDYPGDSFVTFELYAEKNQTRLRFTHEGLESFPQDSPDFSRESFTGGWNYFIVKRLKEFLEKCD